VRLVVADTSPLRYLLQIGEIELLPGIFEKVVIPSVVCEELRHPSAPAVVRAWMTNPAAWLEIMPPPPSEDPALTRLDQGEKAAIALAVALQADLILIDDRQGAAAARQKGFAITGTLGVLDLAAGRGLVNLADACARLRATNFRYSPRMIETMLDQHRKRGEM
jgi:predicted nucleic acid-binding protein